MKFKRIVTSAKRNNIFKYFAFKLFKKRVVFSNENLLNDCLLYKQEFPFLNYQTNSFAAPINDLFNKWAYSGELEYLIHYKNKSVIEPHYGWCLNAKDEVIQKSLPYGEVPIVPMPNYILYKKRKITKIKVAVSIRYNWFNYWHFYNDVIGQLYFLDKNDFDKSVPLIVPAKALNLLYVKEFFESAYTKQRNWIFQDNETFIQLDSVFFCKSIPNIKEQFLYGAKIFKEKIVLKQGDRKIFITRSAKRGRWLRNVEEITALVSEYGFEIIECDELSVVRQIQAFSSAKIILGIHGAGLTNIVYRYPNPCTLIEIFPPNITPTHYYWLAKELKFDYKAILGSECVDNSFFLEKEKLEEQLKLLGN